MNALLKARAAIVSPVLPFNSQVSPAMFVLLCSAPAVQGATPWKANASHTFRISVRYTVFLILSKS